MRIAINDQVVTVPPEKEAELIEHFHDQGVEIYEKQGLELQLLATAVARWILGKMERAIRRQFGEERAMMCRPAKRADPTIHLSKLISSQIEGVLKDATLFIKTDSDGIATDFEFALPTQNQAGRSMDSNRDERQREDNSTQILGRDLQPLVSYDEALST